MPTIKLTQAAVDRLKPPDTGRVEYWDAQLPGFGLRVSAPRPDRPLGRKTWQAFIRINGKMKRGTFGTTAIIPKIDEAREAAREWIKLAKAGIDPDQQKREKEAAAAAEAEAAAARACNTVSVVLERYLAERPTDKSRRRISPEYLKETAGTLRYHLVPALGAKPLTDITSNDLKRLLYDIVKTRPSAANHTLAYAKAFFGWCIDEGLLAGNPAVGVKMPAQRVERERSLDDNEIVLFWRAATKIGYPWGDFGKLLLLLGPRRDELANATWTEFDLKKAVWALPAARTKNNRAHLIHLPATAIGILDGLPRLGQTGWVFSTGGRSSDAPISGFSKGKIRLDAAFEQPIPPWTWHDLRRSFASGAASIRVMPHIIDLALNHSSGRISGVAKIYNRYEYLPERQAALEAWARHINGLVNPPADNVIEFSR